MRVVLPGLAAFVVLVVLWPAVCMGSEDVPTISCSSLLIRLPWRGSADSWGIVVAVVAAVLTYVGLRWLLRRGRRRPGGGS